MSNHALVEEKLKNIFLNNTGLRTIKYNHYLDVYQKYFDPYIGKPVNILEIGIWEGGSLELYQKYLGENCHVYGIDIIPKCKNVEQFLPNCKVFIGDSANPDFLNQIMPQLPKMDIIIDDGGHKTSQQIIAFEKFFPLLNPYGTYICEDLHTNYWDEYRDTEKTFVEYVLERMQLMNKSHDKNGLITIQDKVFTDEVKGVYFANSIICIEKKPAEYDMNLHKRTGEKTCF